MAFDGTNLWIASGDNVAELSPLATIGTFSVMSGSPAGIAFDGTNMWVITDSGSVSLTCRRAAPWSAPSSWTTACPGAAT